jgi:hypothetical protein
MMNQKHCNVSIVHGNQHARIGDGNYVKMNGMVVHDILGILLYEIGPADCSAVGPPFSEIDPGPVTHAANNVCDLPALLGCVLDSGLTPFVSNILIQFEDFDGELRDDTSGRRTTLFKLYDAFLNDVKIIPEVCVASILRLTATIIKPSNITLFAQHLHESLMQSPRYFAIFFPSVFIKMARTPIFESH